MDSDLKDDKVVDNESSFFDSLVYADTKAGGNATTTNRVAALCDRDDDDHQSELKNAIISDSESCEDQNHRQFK